MANSGTYRQILQHMQISHLEDLSLPVCPVCHAAAEPSLYRRFDEITHHCDCVMEVEPEYRRGLKIVWDTQKNPSRFLEQLPDRYKDYPSITVRPTPGNREAIAAARALKLGDFLYLWGSPGNGKTLIAVKAALPLIGPPSGAFHNESVYIDTLKRVIAQPSGTPFEDRIPTPDLERPAVLVLDDLGKAKGSEFVFETLYRVLETRWSNKKTTIITSQRKPSETASRISPDPQQAASLASRFASGSVINVIGNDERVLSGG